MNTAVQSFHDTSIPMKLFDLTILAITFFFSSVAIGADWNEIFISVGGSFSGAVVLAYFRRDSRKIEQVFKTVCSSVSGLILGSTLQEYFAVSSPRFTVLIFFLSGLLSLVFLRSLFNLTERNAAEVCRGAIQRLLGLQLPDERKRRRTKKDGENL